MSVVLVKNLKDRHLLRFIHYNVITLSNRAQSFFRICLYDNTFLSVIDTETYSELSKILRWCFLRVNKYFNTVNYFRKKFHIWYICLGFHHAFEICTPCVYFLTKQISDVSGIIQEQITLYDVQHLLHRLDIIKCNIYSHWFSRQIPAKAR